MSYYWKGKLKARQTAIPTGKLPYCDMLILHLRQVAQVPQGHPHVSNLPGVHHGRTSMFFIYFINYSMFL